MSDILSKYVCTHPFNYMDLQPYQVYVCCPSWCPTSIRDNENEISWHTDSAIDIRKSVLDGSYRHCNHNICPSLNRLINSNIVSGNFIPKDEFLKSHKIESEEDVLKIETNPEHVLFGFDRSCNFKCPSCRDELVPNDDEGSNKYLEKHRTLKTIEDKFSKSIKTILITGSGDPFYSNIYRNYLINFDESKYPQLENIRLITNGKMLNQKMWESLAAKKFIKEIEISIDAGTKYTYEKVTRINGNWNTLISNLKFVSRIETIKKLTLSFVVSEKNYLEMDLFRNLMKDIFKESSFELFLNYTQHVYWGDGAYTQEEVESIQVFNPEHPFFESFLEELNKINGDKYVLHNFHHLL